MEQENGAKTPTLIPGEEPNNEKIPAETPQVKDPNIEVKPNEPPAGNERWNQVYFKMKEAERKLVDREKDIDAIRSHNQALERSIDELKFQKADKSEEVPPDPLMDPDGYKRWNEFQLKKKDREFDHKVNRMRLETMIELQTEMHDDYNEMIKIAERDFASDTKLQEKIWNSPNPPKEAYKYAKSKMQQIQKEGKEEEDRILNVKKVSAAEGDTLSMSPSGETILSDEEKRVVRNMWPGMPSKQAEAKYAKQKIAMGRG